MSSATPRDIVEGAPPGLLDGVNYPFFQSVFDRKSRRMALGMELQAEFFDYASPYEPVPLSELEEALLLMAATGLTGLNLGDIDPSHGAEALVQWTTRTWPSSCSNHGTELFFTNDDGTYLLNLFGLVPEPGEIATLSGKTHDEQVRWMVELYRARLTGASTVAAVRRASQAVLAARRAASESTHPFYWGAFVATGGWS